MGLDIREGVHKQGRRTSGSARMEEEPGVFTVREDRQPRVPDQASRWTVKL